MRITLHGGTTRAKKSGHRIFGGRFDFTPLPLLAQVERQANQAVGQRVRVSATSASDEQGVP